MLSHKILELANSVYTEQTPQTMCYDLGSLCQPFVQYCQYPSAEHSTFSGAMPIVFYSLPYMLLT